MYEDDKNEYNCPLRFQSGANSVKDFAALLERLTPDLRDAFEAERDERQAELDGYVAAFGYKT